MKLLRPTDYRVMPWRNGGGTTTELVIDPGERFRFRASIADVRDSGPFSRFEGYDRHIMIVEGNGMMLACGAHGDIELEPFAPRLFSGDWAVDGILRAGPVRDFNWIVDRSRARSALEVRLLTTRETVHVPSGSTCVIHVFSGALREATSGETLMASEDVDLTPTTATRVALAWAHAPNS
jgi:environmental stress-induced protein Ves